LRADPCGLRAYTGWAVMALRVNHLGPPHVFCVGLQTGPLGQTLIATLILNLETT